MSFDYIIILLICRLAPRGCFGAPGIFLLSTQCLTGSLESGLLFFFNHLSLFITLLHRLDRIAEEQLIGWQS